MAQIYPPIIPATIPACSGTSLDVPFTMNKTVDVTQVDGFYVRIKTIDGKDLFSLSTIISDWDEVLEQGFVSFSLHENVKKLLDIGAYYKVQLAYCTLETVANSVNTVRVPGIYSSVGVLKYTVQPQVSLENIQLVTSIRDTFLTAYPDPVNQTYAHLSDLCSAVPDQYIISYEPSQILSDSSVIEDPSEVLIQYRLLFYEQSEDYANTNLLFPQEPTYITEWQYTRKIDKNIKNQFICETSYAPQGNHIARVRCEVITINGLHVMSADYAISNHDNGQYQIDTLSFYYYAKYNPETAAVDLFLSTQNARPMLNGRQLTIYRWNQNVPLAWEKIITLNTASALSAGQVVKLYSDFTIEQGMSYLYSVQEAKIDTTITSKPLIYSYRHIVRNVDLTRPIDSVALAKDTYPLFIDFDHIFLADNERQLCLKFNPELTSVKPNIVENKTTTLGSKYPFISRNGDINFIEFPLSGLISYNMDNINTFIMPCLLRSPWLSEFLVPVYLSKTEFEKNPANYYQVKTLTDTNGVITHSPFFIPGVWDTSVDQNKRQQFYQINTGFEIGVANTTQLSAKNIKLERIFREEVLNWLTNGKPKILRTPTEGNHIVTIMDVSLASNKTVSRMLYTVSCNAVEIDDYNINTLKKYDFLNHKITTGVKTINNIRLTTPAQN